MKRRILVCFALLFAACGDDGPSANNGSCTPTAGGTELCDGIDNDCDGQVDEGFDVGTECSAGEDACAATGTMICAADKLSTVCDAVAATATDEICDGIDNDCDGEVDEGFDVGVECSAGEGACANSGTIACNPDGTSACTAVAGDPDAAELCDGMDNDCDGEVDEDFATLGEACSVGVGACLSEGVIACNSTKDDVVCDAVEGTPGDEVCDGIDNNCDGETDEGFNVGMVCSAGMGVCAQSGEFACLEDGTSACNAVAGQPAQASETICDNLDNDCDGAVDEGCDEDADGYCTSNFTVVGNPTVCPSGGGDCNDGLATINPGAAEICDGIDNNCVGGADENATDATTYYLDCDGDGYAFDTVGSVSGCMAPTKASAETACASTVGNWTSRAPVGINRDCHPNYRDAFPGQTKYFSNAMQNPPAGTLPHDYNCNGVNQQAFTTGNTSNLLLSDCPTMPYSTTSGSCILPDIGVAIVPIYATTAPQCGQTAQGKFCFNYTREGTTNTCKAGTISNNASSQLQYCR